MNNERLSSSNTEVDKTDFDRAELVLSRLGLSLKDLKGKKTLDLGSGGGEVGRTAKSLGYDVVSIDRYPHRQYPHITEDHPLKVEGKKLETPALVKGDAQKLPFADKSFDLIISHAAPPINWTKEDEERENVVSEALRVLKKEGEFRFGPIVNDEDDVPHSIKMLKGLELRTVQFEGEPLGYYSLTRLV